MTATAEPQTSHAAEATAVAALVAISFSHFLNDTIQSLIPAIYPILKDSFRLDFAEIGFITLAFQLTASFLQPLVGLYTDLKPMPYSLTVGMGSTLLGLLVLSVAPSYPVLLIGAAMVGLGSAVFHPESSRVARMASGGRYGLAQAVFQVGGNVGSSVGPLLAALIVVPYGQSSIAWFSAIALLAMVVLFNVGGWYRRRLPADGVKARASIPALALPGKKVAWALVVLAVLVFSKFLYLAALSSYYTFYLIDRFAVSVQASQILLFVFLFAVAAGTVIGGPIGDRFGRKVVIWFSILGVLPFTLILPYANFAWTIVLTSIIGLVISSAFSAIVVFAHSLMPGRIGMVSGLFFGFAFGMGGLGAALLGVLADHTSIEYVYWICSFLPAAGLLTWFLPNLAQRR